MSFATEVMTRGVQPVQTQAMYSRGFGHDFSNAGIIDFRPGVSFAGLFKPSTSVIDSKYCVNLDKSCNTVNMHIAQLGAAPVAHFAVPVSAQQSPAPVPARTPFTASAPFGEPIGDVAARVACELCAEGLELISARGQTWAQEEPLAAEMQMHIQSLNDQLNSIKSAIAGTTAPVHKPEAADTQVL